MNADEPFWRAVLNEWVWVVTSSIVAAVLGVVSLFNAQMPWFIALAVFGGGIVVAVYRAGWKEHRKLRHAREELDGRGLTEARIQTARNQLAALSELERAFLRQLLRDRHLRFDQISRWHSGTNVLRIYDATTFLRCSEGAVVDPRMGILRADGDWWVHPDWETILNRLLSPAAPPAQPNEWSMPHSLARLCDFSDGLRRVVEAAWDAARKSKSWRDCQPKPGASGDAPIPHNSGASAQPGSSPLPSAGPV